MRLRQWLVSACMLTAVVGYPSRATAMDWADFWARLQELSGPGPFHGHVFSFESLCVSEPNPRQLWFVCHHPDTIRFYFVVEFGTWDDEPREGFTGQVGLRTTQIVAYVPLRRLLNSDSALAAGFDFGAGAGIYRFSGTGVQRGTLWRPSVPVRLRVIPSEFFKKQLSTQWRKALRGITYQVGWDTMVGDWPDDPFNGPPGYQPRETYLKTNALNIDVLALFSPFLH